MLSLINSDTLQLVSGMVLGVGALSVGTLSAALVGCGESDAQKRKRALARKGSLSKKRSVSAKKGSSKSSKSRKSKSGKSKRSASSISSRKKKKRGGDDAGRSAKSLLAKTKSSKRAGIVSAKRRAGSISKSKRAADISTSSRRKSYHIGPASSKSSKSPRRKSLAVKKRGGVSPTKSSKSSRLRRKQLAAQQQQEKQRKKFASDSVRSAKSLKKLELSQHMSKKHYLPVFSSELPDVCVDPPQLQFDVKGGQHSISLHNGSNEKRFAVKVKCSDNQLYRVNPVYTILEPGKSSSAVVNRHNGAPKTDKLVFVIAEIEKDVMDPSVAFKNAAVSYPMVVVPLYALSGLPMAILPPLPGVKAKAGAVNEAPRIIC